MKYYSAEFSISDKFVFVINDVTRHFVFSKARFQKQKHVYTAVESLDVNIYPSV